MKSLSSAGSLMQRTNIRKWASRASIAVFLISVFLTVLYYVLYSTINIPTFNIQADYTRAQYLAWADALSRRVTYLWAYQFWLAYVIPLALVAFILLPRNRSQTRKALFTFSFAWMMTEILSWGFVVSGGTRIELLAAFSGDVFQPFYVLGSNTVVGPSGWDLSFLLLLILVFISAWMWSSSFWQSVRLSSLPMILLGAEVYLFDRRDFNLHFTDYIVARYLPWFTNEVLLAASLSVFGLSSAMMFLRRGRARHD